MGQVPGGRWEAVTVLATVTVVGFGPAIQFPGTLDRDAFETGVAEVLIPALRPGPIVCWDNRSVHQSTRARQRIEAAGCRVLPLPRYSPDSNPIELAFATLKTALRRAQARTFDAVVAATRAAFATITATAARGFLTAAGYALPGQHL